MTRLAGPVTLRQWYTRQRRRRRRRRGASQIIYRFLLVPVSLAELNAATGMNKKAVLSRGNRTMPQPASVSSV